MCVPSCGGERVLTEHGLDWPSLCKRHGKDHVVVLCLRLQCLRSPIVLFCYRLLHPKYLRDGVQGGASKQIFQCTDILDIFQAQHQFLDHVSPLIIDDLRGVSPEFVQDVLI